MDLKEAEILGDAVADHWYYRSKAAALMRLLGGTPAGVILDVGAGSGFFSRYLAQNTPAREIWCVDSSYAGDSDSLAAGKPIRYRQSLGTSAADLVLMMDVLEHVDDDAALLREYVARVGAGAVFVISVPAFGFLWSGHDEFLGHRRRYTLAQIRRVVRDSGLVLEKSAYFFALVFPLALAARLIGRLLGGNPRSQLQQHSPAVNRVLAWICSLELPWFEKNRCFGLTAFCVARKP